MSGGFGSFMIRGEDWASREKVNRSYELLARYVMPHFQGSLVGIQNSARWASTIKETLQTNRRIAIQRATDTWDARNEPEKVNQAD
ncbi:MAG: hypothetical protein BZY68_01420 [SAR202 cluster bacterium MP-SAtl-SRR3965592-G2]|nr:MAG: hypothetical protein BZY68_01420 [SAR202 cluster bacterium MP-SAtl-SRR3965592-G2]